MATTTLTSSKRREQDRRAAMKQAKFASVRGAFKYNNNHFPIQNFYLQDVVKDDKGELSLKTVATIVENNADNFHEKCPMKW